MCSSHVLARGTVSRRRGCATVTTTASTSRTRRTARPCPASPASLSALTSSSACRSVLVLLNEYAYYILNDTKFPSKTLNCHFRLLFFRKLTNVTVSPIVTTAVTRRAARRWRRTSASLTSSSSAAPLASVSPPRGIVMVSIYIYNRISFKVTPRTYYNFDVVVVRRLLEV